MDNRARAATIRKVERRIRAKYRKRCWIVFFVALIIGIVLGIFACAEGWIKIGSREASPSVAIATEKPEGTEIPAATMPALLETPPPTEAPAAAQTPTPTPVPTVEPTEEAEAPNPYAAFFGLSDVQTVAQPTQVPTQEPIVTPASTEAPVVPTLDASLLTATPAAQVEDDASVDVSVMAPVQVSVDPNAKGGKQNPVALREPFTFETQILGDGFPRIDGANTAFDTVKLTLTMNNYLMPDYFASKYANRYKLTGTEAGTEIALKVESSTGTAAIIPQSALQITFESEAGAENVGYQLMDAEIAGRYDVAVKPGETFMVYKRFQYSADAEMDYMVVTYYLDGQAHKVYFELEVAPPSATYTTLEKGSRGDDVKAMQERLVELGYLSDTADGIFGGNTETAIREAQAAGGLTVSGIADNAFQQYIFAANAVPKS